MSAMYNDKKVPDQRTSVPLSSGTPLNSGNAPGVAAPQEESRPCLVAKGSAIGLTVVSGLLSDDGPADVGRSASHCRITRVVDIADASRSGIEFAAGSFDPHATDRACVKLVRRPGGLRHWVILRRGLLLLRGGCRISMTALCLARRTCRYRRPASDTK
jgi:hypothetical protein